ncbi:hypothetical protein AB7M49_004066 [Bradyrhizobium elkanii]
MTLEADEFIRRFLLHALPDGFHRVRYYGFLANGQRGDNLARCRRLLDAHHAAATSELPTGHPKRDRYNSASDFLICPDLRRHHAADRSRAALIHLSTILLRHIMISSLTIFILTAAQPAAHPAADQSAMPIGCRNTNPRAGPTAKPDLFLALGTRSARSFLAETALRIDCAAVVRAVSPPRRGNFPHSAPTPRLRSIRLL